MAAKESKTALVLAGGGIMGAAYEIGCLTALDRLFRSGFSASTFDLYVGVSAGSVIATLAANRIPPSTLFRTIANNESRVFNWKRRDIYRLDSREILSSCGRLACNLFRIFRTYRGKRWRFTLNDLFYILVEQFPAGIFSLEPLQQYLCDAFREERVLDDFHLLDAELYIPAYDLDRGERVIFGSNANRNMHICQAITASCAIPWFFRPHEIEGNHYTDGSIGLVSHIDIALEKGADLIVLVNPRVPVNNDKSSFCLPSLSYGHCSSIAELGITFAWEQAQRIENDIKLRMALETYRRKYPEVDIVVFEPGPEEAVLFFQSPMSNEARHHIMEYGYHLTLNQIADRYEELEKIFSRHTIEVSRDHLQAPPPGSTGKAST
nr:hypothetical protein [Desulfuromonadales bacterium]